MASLLSRDNLRKLDPKVFEKAAALVTQPYLGALENCFACKAIDHAAGGRYMAPERRAFVEAFSPPTNNTTERGHSFWNKAYTPDRQVERATALVQMAAMVRVARASRGVKKPKVSNPFMGA